MSTQRRSRLAAKVVSITSLRDRVVTVRPKQPGHNEGDRMVEPRRRKATPATAYHEAGHVVVATLLRSGWRSVSVEADEETLGRVLTQQHPWSVRVASSQGERVSVAPLCRFRSLDAIRDGRHGDGNLRRAGSLRRTRSE